NRVHGKLERNTAGRPYAGGNALGEHDVMAITGRQIRAGLRNADDRLVSAQLVEREPEIQIALEVYRRHARVGWVIEPGTRAQSPCGAAVFDRVFHGLDPRPSTIAAAPSSAISTSTASGAPLTATAPMTTPPITTGAPPPQPT